MKKADYTPAAMIPTKDLTPSQAVALQKKLRDQVRIEPYLGRKRYIGGADISFNKDSDIAYVAIVVIDLKTLEPVSQAFAIHRMTFPYIPGLLSFREIPCLLAAWEQLGKAPDLLMIDGQGIAHPRRLGIATHLGILLDFPTLGCGKSRLCGSFQDLPQEAGSVSELVDHGEVIGAAFRSKNNCNPLFISPGHRMDLESSLEIVKASLRQYRIPEPTRQAHLMANQLRRENSGLLKVA